MVGGDVESSAITGGLIQTGEPTPTLALSSSVGLVGAAVGPATFGRILDLAGGERRHAAWVTAFAVLIRATLAVLVLMQPLVVLRVVRGPLIHD